MFFMLSKDFTLDSSLVELILRLPRERLLSRRYCAIFEPCGQWKMQVDLLLQLEKVMYNLASVIKASETALEKFMQRIDQVLTKMEVKQMHVPKERLQMSQELKGPTRPNW
jgi:hypothetical protein